MKQMIMQRPVERIYFLQALKYTHIPQTARDLQSIQSTRKLPDLLRSHKRGCGQGFLENGHRAWHCAFLWASTDQPKMEERAEETNHRPVRLLERHCSVQLDLFLWKKIQKKSVKYLKLISRIIILIDFPFFFILT